MDKAPPTPAQARPAPSHGRATQRRRELPHPRTSKARSGALSGNRLAGQITMRLPETTNRKASGRNMSHGFGFECLRSYSNEA